MKKFLFITAFCFLFALSCSAKNGDISGSIYSTDILAVVNGTPVPSYNIGGKTAILLEDLGKLGATIEYQDSIRTLLVTDYVYPAAWQTISGVTRGVPGSVLGNIYESDITTYFNGEQLHTFSLNGKMAAAIEDIGNKDDFSKYSAKFKWDNSTRTIRLDFIGNNSEQVKQISNKSYQVNIKIHNDAVTFEMIPFFQEVQSKIDFDNSFDEHKIYPLYYNGEKVGMRYPRSVIYSIDDAKGNITLLHHSDGYCIYFDLEKTSELLKNVKATELPYEEVLNYYLSDAFQGYSLERIDTETYTFLFIRQINPNQIVYHFVKINKNGAFREYSKEFQPLDEHGKLIFDNVKLDQEKETVTFLYQSKPYIIDLKTDVMQTN